MLLADASVTHTLTSAPLHSLIILGPRCWLLFVPVISPTGEHQQLRGFPQRYVETSFTTCHGLLRNSSSANWLQLLEKNHVVCVHYF